MLYGQKNAVEDKTLEPDDDVRIGQWPLPKERILTVDRPSTCIASEMNSGEESGRAERHSRITLEMHAGDGDGNMGGEGPNIPDTITPGR